MKNTEEKPKAEETADELEEEKLVSVSGGAYQFEGLPVDQLIAGPIQEVEKGQASLRKSYEDFLKATSITNNKLGE